METHIFKWPTVHSLNCSNLLEFELLNHQLALLYLQIILHQSNLSWSSDHEISLYCKKSLFLECRLMSCYMSVALLPDDCSSELKACLSQAAHAVLDASSVSYKFYLSCFCLSHPSCSCSSCLSLLLFNIVIFAVWLASVFLLACSFSLTQLCTAALLLLEVETYILLRAVTPTSLTFQKSILCSVSCLLTPVLQYWIVAFCCFLSVCSLWQAQQCRKVEW